MVSPTGLHGQPSGPGTFLPPSDEFTSVTPPSLFSPIITSIQHTGACNDGGNPPPTVVGPVAESLRGPPLTAVGPVAESLRGPVFPPPLEVSWMTDASLYWRAYTGEASAPDR